MTDLEKDGVTTRPITFVYEDVDASATIQKGTDLKALNEGLRALAEKFLDK